MIFLELFWTFFIIGACSFGGGYSMLALIQNEVVVNHAWLTSQEFADLVAVSQMTPGPIGINSATYAGYTAVLNAGYPQWAAICGSVMASFSVILLPVMLVFLMEKILQRHHQNPYIVSVLRMLRLVTVGLLAAAALSLMTVDCFGTPGLNLQFVASIVIFVAVFLLSWLKKTSPMLLIVGAGVVSLVVFSL